MLFRLTLVCFLLVGCNPGDASSGIARGQPDASELMPSSAEVAQGGAAQVAYGADYAGPIDLAADCLQSSLIDWEMAVVGGRTLYNFHHGSIEETLAALRLTYPEFGFARVGRWFVVDRSDPVSPSQDLPYDREMVALGFEADSNEPIARVLLRQNDLGWGPIRLDACQ